MSDKPKVAFYWCASCGGCEEAVVDLAEEILDVVAAVDIVFWPVALDFKKARRRGHGGRRPSWPLSSTAPSAPPSRRRWPTCCGASRRCWWPSASAPTWAASPAWPTCGTGKAIFDARLPRRPVHGEPRRACCPRRSPRTTGDTVTLPGFYDTVRTLDQVVDVDYYMPGCPPTPKIIAGAVQALLSGELPPTGTVLAPDMALCDECPRKDTKPEKLADRASSSGRTEILIDEETCLLAQGLLCLGPATRAGCGAPVHQRQHALHRLLRPDQPGAGLRRQGACRPWPRCCRRQRRGRDRRRRSTRIPDPVGTLLPLQPAGSLLRRRKMTPVD